MKSFVFATIVSLTVGVLFTHNAFALTVSPIKLELSGDPGKVVSGEFYLLNEQNEEKTFYASFENFEAQGETGTPNFTPGTEGLATWITAPTQITLKPAEQKTVALSIQVPAGAEPGGHFAAVFWSTTPPQVEGGGQVAVGAKIGILVLLKVSGETKEGGGVLEFSSQQGRKFFSSLPISFIYRFQNSGGDRVKPEGEIKIRNIFGGTSATLSANKNMGNILPDSVRKFEVSWIDEEIGSPSEVPQGGAGEGFFGMAAKEWNNFTFGRYTAELNLKYGQDNKIANASFSFFVIPWQLLSIVFIVLALLGFLGVVGLKKYNRWIIAQAMGKKK